jgi:AbrB family looped-hinge helix DNA binding protein
MSLAQSRITAQGQISVPQEVRKKLGLGPGSVLEWSEENGQVVVRRAGRNSSAEIHQAVFFDGPPRVKGIDDMKEGIRRLIRKRHARR